MGNFRGHRNGAGRMAHPRGNRTRRQGCTVGNDLWPSTYVGQGTDRGAERDSDGVMPNCEHNCERELLVPAHQLFR